MTDALLGEAVRSLSDDRDRGASELGRRALEALAHLSEQSEVDDVVGLEREATGWAEALRASRPGMAPIATLVDRWHAEATARREESIGDFRARLGARARALARASRRAVDRIATETALLISGPTTIITISRSSTVAAVFRRLAATGVEAIVPESRPGLEGHRLAEELSALGIPAQLITEGQIGHFASAADIALVGADAVLADGSVVNKAGTSLLALAARQADRPFWVCCESFKRCHLGPDDFPLEETGTEALGAPDLPHVRPRNVAFDVTPPSLVTRWIDEGGSSLGGPRPEGGKDRARR